MDLGIRDVKLIKYRGVGYDLGRGFLALWLAGLFTIVFCWCGEWVVVSQRFSAAFLATSVIFV